MRDETGDLAQGLRYDGVWWRKFAAFGSTYGPEWWKRYSPPAIGAICFALLTQNRRGATDNMRHIFPAGGPNPTRMALEMFSEFAFCISETLERFGPRPRPVRVDLPEHDFVEEAVAAGTGAIVVTAHFGNWDIAALELQKYQRPIRVVMAHEVNSSTNPYVRRLREAAGLQVSYSDRSALFSLDLLHALRRNEIIALQLDRLATSDTARAILFFGQPARFPSGPFELARLSGAPLIPVFAPRRGTRHYEVLFGQPQYVTRQARGARLTDIMTAVAAELETMIRTYPNQWFQFARFWQQGAVASPSTHRRRTPGPPNEALSPAASSYVLRSSVSTRSQTRSLKPSRSS
jgi:lauroyl/myristoyl acyltransferase